MWRRAGCGRERGRGDSAAVALAWLMVPAEVAYRAVVIAWAYHRSPTYPFERFWRNVGDPEVFIGVAKGLLWLGVVLAVVGLVMPGRRRWPAWAALGAHVCVLVVVYDVPALYRS